MRAWPFILLAVSLPVAPALAEKPVGTPDVVVTGQRLSDTERALKECIARKCPVDEDVAATLAHAENQFVAGKYTEARNTLYGGRNRTRRFAKDYPVPVSNVTRAIATVSAHLGDGGSYQYSTIDTLDALKAGLPRDDARVLSARIEVGTMFARLGRLEAADSALRSVAQRARELGFIRVQGMAELRLAALYSNFADYDSSVYAQEERRAIATILNNPDPRYQVYVQAARVLQARKLAQAGDSKAIDAILADLRKIGPTDRPVLLYAPEIAPLRESPRGTYARQAPAGGDEDGVAVLNEYSRLPLRLFDDQWVDVSFYVAPDGHVTDVGVLRASPKLESKDWVRPILGSIALRRYLPLKREANDPGALRVERYTLTSLLEVRLGSRIPQRSPEPRIETLDLSIDPVPPKPRGGSI